MNRAVVPVASMLAIQIMISLCVLALGVMMPAVAADLAINPKLVGVFTAIIYAVAAALALAAAEPIVRLGAVRVCQFALLMAATGRVAMLSYTMPIWAALFAWLVLGERFNAARVVALVLCAAGIAILIYPSAANGIPLGLLIGMRSAPTRCSGRCCCSFRPSATSPGCRSW